MPARRTQRRSRFATGVGCVAAAAVLCLSALAQAQVNVLTANYNNERTNANLSETRLNPFTVTQNSFGKIGTFPVDGRIYAQPLYLSGVAIPGQGMHNVVYVATTHNSIYAIDADSPQRTTPLWQVNLGPAVPSSVLNYSGVVPEVGILGTPVIDPAAQAMYVVSDTLENGAPVFRIHALSLGDGHEMMNGPSVIAASVEGEGVGSLEDGTLQFDPFQQIQRPGLALANGMVYAGFGSHGDNGMWHGWLFAYDASNLQRRSAVLNTSPDGYGASIWQSGRAPAIDRFGDLYLSTGNGDVDGMRNFGESALKLSGTDLSIQEVFTPNDWSSLNDTDWDVGSTGIMLLNRTNAAVLGGKSGNLYVVGGWMTDQSAPAGSSGIQGVKISDWEMFDLAVWERTNGATVFALEPWHSLKALRIVNGRMDPQPLSEFTPLSETLYEGLAVSANGDDETSGILWVTTGNYDLNGVPGTLHALDASDISVELWNSDMAAANRDALGRFAKFAAPVVANGNVYVATFSNALVIYGLLDGSAPAAGPPQVTSVVNGASYLEGAIAPGEVVAIFGSNLGPSQSANAEIDPDGNVNTFLQETEVYFDGVSAPLLYVSSTQLVAVAPFGLAGPTTQVLVLQNNQASNQITVPVAAAAPAVFAADGTGGDQGAITNEDGTPNGFVAPAAPGSIVSLYVTGLGQTSPPGVDGRIASATDPSLPLLPVSVTIANLPAEVEHVGFAPGMVEGIFQIQVRVPEAVITGIDYIVLQVGRYTSPNTISIFVQ